MDYIDGKTSTFKFHFGFNEPKDLIERNKPTIDNGKLENHIVNNNGIVISVTKLIQY